MVVVRHMAEAVDSTAMIDLDAPKSDPVDAVRSSLRTRGCGAAHPIEYLPEHDMNGWSLRPRRLPEITVGWSTWTATGTG